MLYKDIVDKTVHRLLYLGFCSKTKKKEKTYLSKKFIIKILIHTKISAATGKLSIGKSGSPKHLDS